MLLLVLFGRNYILKNIITYTMLGFLLLTMILNLFYDADWLYLVMSGVFFLYEIYLYKIDHKNSNKYFAILFLILMLIFTLLKFMGWN